MFILVRIHPRPLSPDAFYMDLSERKMSTRVAPWLLVAGAVLLAFAIVRTIELVSFGAWGNLFFSRWAYNVIYLLVGSAIICGGIGTKERRAGWLFIGGSILMWAFGNIYYTTFLWDAAVIPVPSIADFLWTFLYPGCFIGLVLVLRPELRHKGHGLWLDGLVAALTVAAFASAFVLGPIVGAAGSNAEWFWTLIGPVGDTVVLALLVGAAASVGWTAARGIVLVTLGFVTLAFLDFLYQLMVAAGTWIPGSLLEAAWPPAFLLIAAGAWQYRPVAHRKLHERNALTVIIAPVLCALAAVGLLVYDHFNPVSGLSLLFATLAILAVIARMALTFSDNVRLLRSSENQAVTDPLTGLWNRRKLKADLDEATRSDGAFLVLFDLDGFKSYNDTFGHPAGDALLQRLARLLVASTHGRAQAYRIGGDEFCLLGRSDEASPELTAALGRSALSESGNGFLITTSCGSVMIPSEAADSASALREADLRLYAEKDTRRSSPARQACDALLVLLAERNPKLATHMGDMAELAPRVALKLGMAAAEIEEVRLAAQLHDIGKAAIPDRILNKKGPLTVSEMTFTRQHTLIGERIVAAAQSLRPVAKLIRSSHERVDGRGYPDGLVGDQIPLGSQIVAVCDSYDAITSDRAYRERSSSQDAVTELRRCSGSQFAPHVVEAVIDVLYEISVEALDEYQHPATRS